jgi:hypothetical protein
LRDLWDLAVHGGGGGARAGAVFEREGGSVADLADDVEGGLEVFVGLAGEADDEVAAERYVRAGGADLVEDAEVIGRCVVTVHRLEDAVRPGLHGEVQVGHELRNIAVRGDEVVGHVDGVAGRVADPLEVLKVREAVDEGGEGLSPVFPGVDVLAKQGELPATTSDELLGSGDEVGHRTADLGPAGIGYDAVGAEFVAAFLDGEEGGYARAAAGGKGGELIEGRKVSVDRTGTAFNLAQELRQAVVCLRTDDKVDGLGPALGLGAFSLSDAAGERDHGLRAILAAEATDFAVGLLRSLLADVAGVEDDHVGVVPGAAGAMPSAPSSSAMRSPS